MFRRVARLDDLRDGALLSVALGFRHIVLARVEGHVYALEDRCAHRDVPLSKGRLEGTALICAAHEWRFDVTNGYGLEPCTGAVRRYPVELREGEIWVDV